MIRVTHQPMLFDRGPPIIDPTFSRARRTALAHGAWIELAPQWLSGHEALFQDLLRAVDWQASEREMYGHTVAVPRLLGRPEPGRHPVLPSMASALSGRYGRTLDSVQLALYRDGRDSVAWHGDRLGSRVDNCVVAIVSVGERRRFLLRPHGGGASLRLTIGWGDLLVLGGTCQATWQHSLPKAARAGPRIAIVFREKVTDASPP